MKAGFQLSGISYEMNRDTISEPGYRKVIIGDGTTHLFQPYFQWQWSLAPRWVINAGMHFMYFRLTKSFSPEPRIGLKYRISDMQSLMLA
jgi:hypothetical protein